MVPEAACHAKPLPPPDRLVTVVGRLVKPAPLPTNVPEKLPLSVRLVASCALPTVPVMRFVPFKPVSPAPLPVKLLPALFRVKALEYVPDNRALGTVPLASWLALRLVSDEPLKGTFVKPAPLPVKVPLKLLAALFNVTALAYVPDNCALGTVPLDSWLALS